ncbi:DgsA anti-repressor MtfA [Edwardsiella piscicida]|nr:DgsA anti-repressor MtfA [Edwardsiella piscicida]ELM3730628.1 DgsA anti-repressor MtfA [Edwardsiella piscicida]ELV7535459.1 DgsA anti-repressor MtfA [Edwardsiella piscicida]ELV7538052.1 DgsA anti-repressor MtfA [Edwardsiella piscicida]
MIKWPWRTQLPAQQDSYPWSEACAIPLLAALSDDEQRRLIALARQVIRQKRLVPLQELRVTPLMEARIALLFALPVLALGIEWLDGFHEILLYPEPYVLHEEWEDDIGLVHCGPSIQAGQCSAQGPIVLNWLDVRDSFDRSGYNLVIHETAHKLDMRSAGIANGIPPIPLREIAAWEQALHAAMEAIQEEADLLGEAGASLDAYAASEPAECFAVLSEYFFSAPELLAERFPAVYRHFVGFYRQDPLQRLRQSGLLLP